jgi:hypothetical protein
MNPVDLRKLIDSCRNEGDLRLPEMKPLADQLASDRALQRDWERARDWDAAIREAMNEVPIPAGLEERLFQALTERESAAIVGNGPGEPAPAAEVVAPPAVEELPSPVPRKRGTPRGWKWVGSLVGLAAAVLLVVLAWPRSAPMVAANEVDLVDPWVKCLRPAAWTHDRFPEHDFPLPGQIVRPYRWQSLSGLPASLRVVCYQLPASGNRAYLFVARCRPRSALPVAPPTRPYPVPPWSAGAWRTTNALYLLAVEGDAGQYRQVLRGGSNWVASARAAGRFCPVDKV